MVPRDWIAPPDYDTADGELLDDEYNEEDDERASMLRREDSRRSRISGDQRIGPWGSNRDEEINAQIRDSIAHGEEAPRLVSLKDSSGRDMPPSERAPLPRRM